MIKFSINEFKNFRFLSEATCKQRLTEIKLKIHLIFFHSLTAHDEEENVIN